MELFSHKQQENCVMFVDTRKCATHFGIYMYNPVLISIVATRNYKKWVIQGSMQWEHITAHITNIGSFLNTHS